jgi:hypothetical protein
LADDTYAELAIKQAAMDPSKVDRGVRENVLTSFGRLSGPFATRKHHHEWNETVTAVRQAQ